MGLRMKEKQSVAKEVARRYRRARKKDKGQILDEFIKLTGYNRKYGADVLRIYGKRLYVKGNLFIEAEVKKKLHEVT